MSSFTGSVLETTSEKTLDSGKKDQYQVGVLRKFHATYDKITGKKSRKKLGEGLSFVSNLQNVYFSSFGTESGLLKTVILQ